MCPVHFSHHSIVSKACKLGKRTKARPHAQIALLAPQAVFIKNFFIETPLILKTYNCKLANCRALKSFRVQEKFEDKVITLIIIIRLDSKIVLLKSQTFELQRFSYLW